MGRYFDNKEQARDFRNIAFSFLEDGAQKVGLSGSRAEGKQNEPGKKGDFDIVVVYPAGHAKETFNTSKWTILDPRGEFLPERFEAFIVPTENGDEGSQSLKEKAKWWYKKPINK